MQYPHKNKSMDGKISEIRPAISKIVCEKKLQ
jgi:hypothetical protein